MDITTQLSKSGRRSSSSSSPLFWAAPLPLVILLIIVSPSQGQYDNTRCKCVCPNPQVVVIDGKASKNDTTTKLNYSSSISSSGSTNRTIYISTGNPGNLCNCYTVVLPIVGDIHGKEGEFCPRCDCVFESRNLDIIQVVVILVTWIISLLMIYMLFLTCLEKFSFSKQRAYQEHTNEDDESVGGGGTSHPMQVTTGASSSSIIGPGRAVVDDTSLGPSSSILNRVGHQQSKWKRQVQEQRKNIYDRHAMLN